MGGGWPRDPISSLSCLNHLTWWSSVFTFAPDCRFAREIIDLDFDRIAFDFHSTAGIAAELHTAIACTDFEVFAADTADHHTDHLHTIAEATMLILTELLRMDLLVG